MSDYSEIFEKPLLSEVVFEARFNPKFKIQSDIGVFQERITEDFPDAQSGSEDSYDISPTKEIRHQSNQFWEFINKTNQTKCKIMTNRFSLHSESYKSWEDWKGKPGFKVLIFNTMKKFQDLFAIPSFTRVGLRYINKIKVGENPTVWYKNFFKPLYPVDYYPVENLLENYIRVRVKKEPADGLTVQTLFQEQQGVYYFILDFDVYKLSVTSLDLPNNLNNLHDLIIREFYSLITENCKNLMRGTAE